MLLVLNVLCCFYLFIFATLSLYAHASSWYRSFFLLRKGLLLGIGFLVSNLLCAHAVAQNETSIWYFGQRSGLSFQSGTPQPLLGWSMEAWEGCSSWCDADGNLLFYTDGRQVWNRFHQPMPNGDGLMGSESTTQCLIVPMPGSSTLCYLFTLDFQGGSRGLRYSLVNMSLDEGRGDVTSVKNQLLYTPSTEKITAVLHANGQAIWLITHGYGYNTFYCHLITTNGILPPVLSQAGSTPSQIFEAIGYLKASPNGKKLAIATTDLQIAELFDFDDATGVVSNPLTLAQDSEYYGLEFSPDNSCLYITGSDSTLEHGVVLQYNLLAGSPSAIVASRFLLDSNIFPAALQTAPDGKIYLAYRRENFLGVINEPNLVGKDCQFVRKGITLLRPGNLGLPNAMPFLFRKLSFSYQEHCQMQFSAVASSELDSLRWEFGDSESGQDNTSREAHPSHTYGKPGIYLVQLTRYFRDGTTYSVTKSVVIKQTQLRVGLGPDLRWCESASVTLQPQVSQSQVHYRWSDQSTGASLPVSQPGTYWVEVRTETCVSRDSIVISLEDCLEDLDIPNVFTPNGDQLNPTFEIKGILKGEWQLLVWNRWGQEVYRSEGYQNDWEANDLATGIYYYQLQHPSSEIRYKGYVQVLR